MAGLLAWAADVVGGSGQGGEQGEGRFSSVVFAPEQQRYAVELDRKAVELRRVIQDLRARIPPPDISKSLPHLHAHSLASNADLAFQLNAHSTTRQQAQQREITLQEENAAYEKAISSCQNKTREKLQEADLLQSRLKDMDISEKELRAEFDELQSNMRDSQFSVLVHDPKHPETTQPLRNDLLKQVDDKKKELISMEGTLQCLENEWTKVQQDSIKKLLPAQREKMLERQLHDLIEQLTTKQAQAESLISEIKEKDGEFQKLNGFRQNLEVAAMEANTARSRFGRNLLGPATACTSTEYNRHLKTGKSESQQKFMFLRSAFVLYILALHVIVFIKISF